MKCDYCDKKAVYGDTELNLCEEHLKSMDYETRKLANALKQINRILDENKKGDDK